MVVAAVINCTVLILRRNDYFYIVCASQTCVSRICSKWLKIPITGQVDPTVHYLKELVKCII